MSYGDPVSQRSMALDEYRNGIYRQAMESVISPASVVLDLGAGIGILGLIAASLGAKKVYLVEPEATIEVARQIARANGLEDKVVFVRETIEKAKLPEKVDVILSVFTGNFLLEEDLLPSLFFARDRYLKKGGVMLPSSGSMRVAPASLSAYYDENIRCWSSPQHGIDHSLMHQFAVNTMYFDWFRERSLEQLADPQTLSTCDFTRDSDAACDAEVAFECHSSGLLHGVVGWFDAVLGDQVLSTSPDEKATHWRQVFLPIDEPLEVKAGDEVIFHLSRPQHGEWSWRIQTAVHSSQHSTFLSRPITPSDLARRSARFKPLKNESGRIAVKVLEMLDGDTSVEEIAETVFSQEPTHFNSVDEVILFVQSLAHKFGE